MGKVLGQSPIKKELELKVTGRAVYTGDIELPGMLECRVLKSPYAHAGILGIDTVAAEELPGVRAVLTASDRDLIRPEPFATMGSHADYYVLPTEAVYIAGEQVAAVAAETCEIAKAALKLIKVSYDPLPAVFDPLEALKPETPVIYPDMSDNRSSLFGQTEVTYGRGNISRGFAESDHIISSSYRWPTTAHAPLEPYRTVAHWEAGHLTVWLSTQTVWEAADAIAWSLGLPTNRLTVINQWVGGGFGSKVGENHLALACITAALAKKTGRPVRSILDMDEQFVMSHHNCGPGYYEIKGGIKADGRPVAKQTTVFVSDGGHGTGEGSPVAFESGGNVYRFENLEITVHPAICNLNISGHKRSFGDAEGMFCSEQFADELAETAGVDPLLWRLQWAARPGDPTCLYYMWGELAGGNYAVLLTKAAQAFGWKEKWRGWRRSTEAYGLKKRGIGLALSMHQTGGFGASGSLVRINNDGSADVNCTAEELGQGIKSAIASCVAEVLGLSYDEVTVSADNTAFNPRGGGIFGSRGTPVVVAASAAAAEKAKDILLERAAELLETGSEELVIEGGRVFIKDDPEKGKTIGEIAAAGEFDEVGICAFGKESAGAVNPENGEMLLEKSLAAAFCEVEVDTETGAVKLLKAVLAADCGAAINTDAALVQIDGGLIQGMGSALYEELVFDRANEGIILNAGFPDYKVPTFPETADFVGILHSDPADAPTCRLNAKGMSESTLVPIAPAIANAVYNATGVRVKNGPLTPESVLAALGKI